MIKVSTSILTCNNRIQATEKLNKTNTDYIHIDYMDGIFVDNKEFTIEEIKTLSKISTKKLDIHIMPENQEPIIQELKEHCKNTYYKLQVDNEETVTFYTF